MIRPAKPSDLEAIVDLGEESLKKSGYHEHFVISRDKIRNEASECISGPMHFAWVSEVDGKVVGAVIAKVFGLMFAERNQATVLMYYCQIPADGGWLIKKLFKWYLGRPGIKVLDFTLERGADEKIGRFLEKLGFNNAQPTYNHIRGFTK